MEEEKVDDRQTDRVRDERFNEKCKGSNNEMSTNQSQNDLQEEEEEEDVY